MPELLCLKAFRGWRFFPPDCVSIFFLQLKNRRGLLTVVCRNFCFSPDSSLVSPQFASLCSVRLAQLLPDCINKLLLQLR